MVAIAYGVILAAMMIALVHMIITDHKEQKRHRERMGRHRKIVREAEDKFYIRLREELKKQD